MPDDETLSERLRRLKMREVQEVDEEAVARAAREKATLSERMRALLDAEASIPPGGTAGDGEALPSSAAAPAPEAMAEAERVLAEAGRDRTPQRAAYEADETVSLADRLRAIQEAESVEVPEPEEPTKSALRWFFGQERQKKGSGPVTVIPGFDEERWEELSFYAVDAPYAFVRVLRDKKTGELLYEAIEPQLSKDEEKILSFIHDGLVRGLNVDPGDLKPEERVSYLREAVRQIIRDYRIRMDTVSQSRVEYYIRRDFLGLGAIHVMMLDPNIEDISCDGPREPLWIFHREHESIPTTVVFRNDAELDGFVIRMAQRSGKAISVSEPILDAALPDGSRLQATLGHEVTQNGSTFTIRRFKPDPFTPMDLVRFGTMSDELLTWMWFIVQHGNSLIFSGGTASGKTTGLNAICQFIPFNAKVVSIEDTREVNLPHQNWIKAVTRVGSTAEGAGEIGMFELLKAALRQRPEYILVGEVRGIEATVAFQAMATGHTVYSTMHADSARSVVYRLENEPINIPRLVLQALDVIAIQAQVRFKGKRVRRIKEVVELVGMDPTTRELLTNRVFTWNQDTDTFTYHGRSYLLERIAEAHNWTQEQLRAEFDQRRRVVRYLVDSGINSVEGLTEVVKAYYRDPKAVLEMMEAQ